MPQEGKVVSQKSEFKASVKVTREVRAVINPNGRGYSEDNVVRYLNDEVMEFAVKAPDAASLAVKVNSMISNIDDD